MKMPIQWHEECFRNQSNFYKDLENELEALKSKVERTKKSLENYKLQIETAKKLKKDSFDCEKFMKKR